MRYLDDDKIGSMISDYIADKSYDYAIMINGDWGSGKTYFVKTNIIPKLKKEFPERSAVYISLFGLKSTQEISNLILASIIESKVPGGKKILPHMDLPIKIILELISDRTSIDALKELDKGILSSFVSYDNFYFIFDDLERCPMPINQTLGYINHFLEQNSTKVIIVANEKEVGSLESKEDYQITSTIESLITANLQNSLVASNKQEHSTYQKNEESGDVGNRPANNTAGTYYQIKEKLVGNTIHYRPELEKMVPIIFEKILGGYFNSPLKETIISKTCSLMKADDHYNLRTLQFALAYYKKICVIFVQNSYDIELYEETLVQVLLSILQVSIAHKNGEPEDNWGSESEYGAVYSISRLQMNGGITSFKFIPEYVYHGIFDNEHIKSVLDKYIKDLEFSKKMKDDPIDSLKYYWMLEDDEIESYVEKMLRNLNDGMYNGTLFHWIISILLKLKGIGIEPVGIDLFFDKMENFVIKGEKIDTARIPAIKAEDEEYVAYENYIEKLKVKEKEYNTKFQLDTLNKIFTNISGWGAELYDYYRKNEFRILNEHGFLKSVDLDLCLKAIQSSKNDEFSDFRKTIGTIYRYSNIDTTFPDDEPYLEELRSRLDNLSGNKIKEFNIRLFKIQLEEILSKYKNKLIP